MPRLRIFISSPGDVAEERLRSVLIVDKLSQDYSRYFEIEGYRWDHEPMLASGHFQDAIDPPSRFDIVIMILWSRLGTALPEKTAVREYRGIDDRVPVTGTEWEYEDALKAARRSGAPDLLAFRNVSRAPIDPRDPAAQVAQLNALNEFWRRHFVDRGVFLAAYEEYTTLEQFAAHLEGALRKLIERRIRALARGEQAGATLWFKEPFRGLQSFDFEHAPIFFGRYGLVTKAIERLAGNARDGAAFLLVSGASGSGKSSMVKAGMVPRLMKPQRIANVGFLRAAVMRPATGGADLVLGLAQALVADIPSGPAGLPELIGPGQDVHSLADYLRSLAAAPGFAFSSALGRVTEAARREGVLLAHEEARLILVIDQLEEIVTVAGIDDRERQLFITLLAGLARSGLVWIIATLRDDFWARLARIPELAALSDGNGRLDVARPSSSELAEMISKPALVAGLAFQPNPLTNITLDRVIAEEAEAAPGVLPLLSFTLDELYKDARARGSNELSWQHYESLGRLEGAIANRAQAIVDGMSPAAQAALPRVLRALAAVGAEGRPVGRTAPLGSFAESTPARVLVDAFIAARLLVASSEQGKEVVRLAHEALISRWQKALDQLELDRRYLETRSVVEAQYGRWDKSTGRSKNRLLLRDPDLANAVALASRWGNELDPALRRFISTSRRRVWLRQGFAAAATMVFGMIAVAGYFFFQQAEEARKQSEISQLVALAQSRLREGHTREAIEQAARTFERSPSFETRSALLPALLAVSPHLVGQLDIPGDYAPALAWIGDATLAYATTEGEMRFLEALRRKSGQPLPAARTVVKSRADGQAPLILTVRPVAADRMLAVLQDGSIATFSVRSGEPQLRAPASPIDVRPSPQGAAISRSGSHVVLATTSGGAHLLACKGMDGAPVCSDTEVTPLANAVQFSPRDDWVALGTEDGKVHVLSLDGAEAMAPLAVGFPVAALAWSPTRDRLAIGGTEGNVAIYDVKTASKLGDAPTRRHPVNAIDWNPAGDLIVFACEPSVLCVARTAEDGTVEPTPLRFAGHAGAVRKAAFAADGVHVVSSSDAPEILVWSTNPDRRVGFALRSSVDPPVDAISYGSAGKRLAAAYTTGDVAVWDAADALTGDAATSVEAQIHLKGPAQDARAIAWRADGALAVAYQDGRTIAVWPRDLKAEPRVTRLPATPRQIAFQRAGSRLVAQGEDDQIHFVDPADPGGSTVRRRLPWSARAFVLNPIRDELYASRGGGEIAVWDLAAQSSLPSLRVEDPVAALGLAVSPDGRLLAATGGDRFVKIFDLEAAKLLTRLPLSLATLGRETRGNVAFSSDGALLAGLGADGRVYIWQRDGTSFAPFVVVGSAAEAADGEATSPGDYGAALAWLGPRTLAVVDKRGSIRVVNLDTASWQARRRDLYYHSP